MLLPLQELLTSFMKIWSHFNVYFDKLVTKEMNQIEENK